MANPKQYNSQTKHYQTSNQTKELTTPKAGQKSSLFVSLLSPSWS